MYKPVSLLLSLSALSLTCCKPQSEPPTVISPANTPAPSSASMDAAGTLDPKTALVASRVRKIVAEQLGLAIDRVTLSSTWKQLGADSLDAVELVMAFEEEFHVEISDSQAEAMKTLGDAVAFLAQRAKP